MSKIFNLIILDESGSMEPIREQALVGANKTLQTIRVAQQESPDDNQMITFVTFNSEFGRADIRKIIDCQKIEDVADIKYKQYNPQGCTPLFDAIGISVKDLQSKVKADDHVLVTVITDGFENFSCVYNAAMVKELIETLSAQGWVFTFIGANQDSEQAAKGLGISSAMDFMASAEGSEIMWDKMNSSRRAYYKKVRYAKETGLAVDLKEDFFSLKSALNRVTPENIENLRPGEVFVFGSNLQGEHRGGAARLAFERFGAVWGQGVGLQGQSYALPTTFLSLREIAKYVDEFIWFADQHPEMTFLVTRVGCGMACFRDDEIAPLFARAFSLPNVFLPASFWKVLSYKY